MDLNNAAKKCGECPLCNFTRNSKKKGFFYNIARRVQSGCPCCKEANKQAGKEMQKSKFF